MKKSVKFASRFAEISLSDKFLDDLSRAVFRADNVQLVFR